MNNAERHVYKSFTFLGTGGNFRYKSSLVANKSINRYDLSGKYFGTMHFSRTLCNFTLRKFSF